jgi:hypothetical protein
MLQEIETTHKPKQPLVTSMGLNYKTMVRCTAAKFLAFELPEDAAQCMYDTIEDSMTTEVQWDDRRKFWEDVIKEMTEIAPSFSAQVAKLYFKLVVKTYGMPKP